MENYDPNKIYLVPLDLIWPDDDFNSRGLFLNSDVHELAKDIKQNGLNFPIIIEPWFREDGTQRVTGKDYRLISGYRRYRAHLILGLTTIRSMVKVGLSDADARILNLSENLNRKDLDIDQEANAIKRFTHWDLRQLASRIGRSRGWVQQRIDYLDLPEDIKKEVRSGVIKNAQISEITSLPLEMQYAYVRKTKDKLLLGNKREVSALSVKKRMLADADGAHPDHRSREEIFEMQEHVKSIVGHGLATRLLAWAAKEISTLDMHRTLRDEAKKHGKMHVIPEKHKLIGVEA